MARLPQYRLLPVMNLFSRKKQQGWLVAVPEGDQLMLAYVRPNSHRPAVVFCEEREFDASEPKSIERISRELHADRFQCITLLHPDQYQMFTVEAPAVRPEELKAAVRWRIKDMIDYHVDDAVVDVLDVPPAAAAPAKNHFMYVVVTRAESVRSIVDFFDRGRISLEVIDIPEAAQRNLAAYMEPEGRGVLLVSFDKHGGLITFTSGGELYLSRRIDVSAADLVEDNDGLRGANLDRAALEVQRSLDHFERQFSYVSLDRVLVAPLPRPTDLVERIAANIHLSVQPFDLDAVVDVGDSDKLSTAEGRCRWLKLIGAGLRMESKAL